MRVVRTTILAAAVLVLIAPLAAAQSGPSSCTTTGQNLYVREVMSDLYFWYREIPNLDPVTFDSPEAYLEAIRYLPRDRTFSYITSRAANDAFFSTDMPDSTRRPRPTRVTSARTVLSGPVAVDM